MKPSFRPQSLKLITLSAFTGDPTECSVNGYGYSGDQAKEMTSLVELLRFQLRLKLFLLITVKEAIGSGWAQSFRAIIGDFNES